jgi:hypothetical protein
MIMDQSGNPSYPDIVIICQPATAEVVILTRTLVVERVTRIELALSAWE